jgi:RNA-directed DNA polymerase
LTDKSDDKGKPCPYTAKADMTRLTKLDRLGEAAKTKKEAVFNNLGHIIDLDLLQEMYRKSEGRKAIGTDGITKAVYGINLEANLKDLIRRIRNDTYRAKPARQTEIPKEDGSTRPLVISCFEDKLVQMAVAEILTRIYEPLFMPCSFGFRKEKSCHDALRALLKHAYVCHDGAVVEIDICKYFNTIPHKNLKEILQKKISDKRFLRLLVRLITAPTRTKEAIKANIVGCPQGSIISPILANIYLHTVVDEWFSEIKKSHLRGIAEEVRYADDMVFIFQRYDEAVRFFEALPKRLKKFGLDIHTDDETGNRESDDVEEPAIGAR